MPGDTDKITDGPNAKWYERNQRRKGNGPSALVLLEKSGGLQLSRNSLGSRSGEGHCRQELPMYRQEDVNRGGTFKEGARTEDTCGKHGKK